MKVENAAIKAILRERVKPDGTQSIAIRVSYKGRVVKTLPISVPKNKWNDDKGIVVKAYPNSAMMNTIINDEIQKVRKRELELQANGETYTAKDLIVIDDDKDNKSSDIDWLVSALIKERALKPNSVKAYNQIVKWLKEYYCKNNNTLKLEAINGDNIQAFCKWMIDVKGCSDASVCSVCKRLAALHRYAQELVVVSEQSFPFKKFKYWKTYKYGGNKPALTNEQLLNVESYWANEFFTYDIDGNILYRSDKYTKRIYQKSSEEFALTMYLCCYYFQGLALCDMAELKVSQFKLKHATKKVTTNHETYIEFNGERRKAIVPIEEEVAYDYYDIEDVQRQKTRQDVPIVIEITPTINALIGDYITTADTRDGYLFPIYKQDGLTDDEKNKQLHSTYHCINNSIHNIVKKVNEKAHRYRQDMCLDDDWTDIPENLTFYSARHTFASIMASNGVANADLAKMMGRTVAGIDNYIHSIRNSDQLIQIKSAAK